MKILLDTNQFECKHSRQGSVQRIEYVHSLKSGDMLWTGQVFGRNIRCEKKKR